MSKLKPCPFCGMPAEKLTHTYEKTVEPGICYSKIYPYFPETRDKWIITVSCSCGCRFRKEIYHGDELVEAWNRRTKD